MKFFFRLLRRSGINFEMVSVLIGVFVYMWVRVQSVLGAASWVIFLLHFVPFDFEGL